MLDLINERDAEILRQAALILESENKHLVAKNFELLRENLRLKGLDSAQLAIKLQPLEEQLARRNRDLFGKSSEKRRPEAPAGGSAADSSANDEKKKQTGHGPRAQPQLPSINVQHELDAADRKCGHCGGVPVEWEGEFEESEEIDIVERRFVKKRHQRKKYRCTCNATVLTAPGPLKLFKGAHYSIDFAIHVAVQKYLDHLPLERQVKICRREGLIVDSQTLWNQIEALARVLGPLPEALRRHIFGSPVVGADETRWELLRAKHGQAPDEAGRWTAWTVRNATAVYFRILPDRSAESAKLVLTGYTGTAMIDGYGAYAAYAAQPGVSIRFVHCWAHVRRKFEECEASFPQAGEILDLIRGLYRIEREARGDDEGAIEKRRELRNTKSREQVKKIFAWIDARYPITLPESGLGKALGYPRDLRAGLTAFLDDPRIPIDNNFTERGVRGLVVGRKNHYGSRSRRGTEVASLFYSVFESCKANDIDPTAYLRRIVPDLLRGATVVPLPHEVRAARVAAGAPDSS